MESRPQNPEFRNNPKNFHPGKIQCTGLLKTLCTAHTIKITRVSIGVLDLLLLYISNKFAAQPVHPHSQSDQRLSHLKADHHRPTSKMPFEWRFAGGPMGARHCMLAVFFLFLALKYNTVSTWVKVQHF